MSADPSEAAALISPISESKNLTNKDHTYDTFSKPSVDGSVNQEDDSKVLSSSGQHYVVYTRRWYILLVYASMAFLQAAGWNTWGPIADTAKPVLNWTDADIALLTNMGCITYVLSAFVFAWLLDKKGLRTTLLICSTLLMIGLVIRCFPVQVEYAKLTMNIGALLIGFSAPGINAGPPLVSAVWFPQYQRTTSTAIMASSAYLGVAGSFLIGPLIVTDITNTSGSRILPFNESYSYYDGEDIDPVIRRNHLREINTLLYIECAVGVFFCLLIWAYFPAKPPSPPSASAHVERQDFMRGAATLSRSSAFWMPALAYACSIGVYNVWTTQFDTIFQHLVGVGQNDAGWIGFYSNLAGVIASLVFARVVDCLGGQMKKVLIGITVAAIICLIWFLLICLEIISFNLVSLYISCVVSSLLLNSTVPIYFEVTVEGVYPVAEGITTGVLTWLLNVVGLFFLFVLMIPDVGISWMNWTTLGAVVFTLPCLFLYKERYNRSLQDTQIDEGIDNQSLPSQA
ncbi:solute carrier family 49 member 4-like [Amphiura filiformis]|uniref:solute carrier family 49 member 4-like n=1 Tax=Amphiura filiformis TaxID=82378 RepID=UPI003B2170BA